MRERVEDRPFRRGHGGMVREVGFAQPRDPLAERRILQRLPRLVAPVEPGRPGDVDVGLVPEETARGRVGARLEHRLVQELREQREAWPSPNRRGRRPIGAARRARRSCRRPNRPRRGARRAARTRPTSGPRAADTSSGRTGPTPSPVLRRRRATACAGRSGAGAGSPVAPGRSPPRSARLGRRAPRPTAPAPPLPRSRRSATARPARAVGTRTSTSRTRPSHATITGSSGPARELLPPRAERRRRVPRARRPGRPSPASTAIVLSMPARTRRPCTFT